MDIRVSLALEGDLEGWRRRTITAWLTALKESVDDEATHLQGRLRSEVRSAGLGDGIANAWRKDIHPTGRRLSWEPSAFLYSRAAHIIDNFTKGEAYGPKSAGSLAIPIPGSPADGLRVRRGGSRTALAEARFGPLKVIRTRSGGLMLVGFGRDNGRGGFRRLATRTHKSGGRFTPLRQPVAMIPLFWLVKQARLRARLHWPSIVAGAKPGFAGRVARRLRTRIDAANRVSAAGRTQII